jgi:hypothetical protein
MIRNFKTALGMSFLAALAVGVAGVGGASATAPGVGNHFTSASPSGKTNFDLTVATGTAHETSIAAYGTTIGCHHITYSAHHVNTATFTALTVTPEVKNCTTGSGDAATAHMNGCHYEYTAKNTGTSHATVHLRCPLGKKIEWTTPGGTMKFGAQTFEKGGVTYSAIEIGGKHAITINKTIEGTQGTCHGVCQIFGTATATATMSGSMTLQGTDTDTGLAANLTAT